MLRSTTLFNDFKAAQDYRRLAPGIPSAIDMEERRMFLEEGVPNTDESTNTSIKGSGHPREDLESWRWPLILICLGLTMLIVGSLMQQLNASSMVRASNSL